MSQANTMDATGPGPALGGRLPLLLPEHMTTRQYRLYERLAPAKRAEAAKGGFLVETREGALIGPFNSYFYVPDISDGYIAWIEAQHAHLPFSPEVREAVILTIGAAWNVPFEIYAHRAVALSVGFSSETIEALVTGNSPGSMSDDARVARDFTYALVTRNEVEDALYDAARRTFGDAGLVSMTHLIGLYLSVSAVLKAFRIPAPNSAATA